MRYLLLTALFVFCFSSQAQVRLENFPKVNGPVRAIETTNDTLFLGGDFTRVYAKNTYSAYMAVKMMNDTQPERVEGQWPIPNGHVEKVLSDGEGGVYLSGGFSRVGKAMRIGVAHIDSNGIVTNRVSGIKTYGIKTMVLQGDTLFLGGDVNSLNGRAGVALIGKSSLSPVASTADVYGIVDVVLSDGAGGWYLGGWFEAESNNIIYENFVHLLPNGLPDSTMQLNPNGRVYSIVKKDSLLFFCGEFTSVQDKSRDRIASANINTGKLTEWKTPYINQLVYSIVVSDSSVYAGGGFITVDTFTRNRLASFHIKTGALTSWDPGVSGTVYVVAAQDTVIYAGGSFASVSGAARNNFAEIGKHSGKATAWVCDANHWVRSIVTTSSYLYVGGHFTSIGTRSFKSKLAKIDRQTGIAENWGPYDVYSNFIRTVKKADTLIYATGYFERVNGVPTGGFAVFGEQSGKLLQTSLDLPNIGCLDVYDTTIMVGSGDYNMFGDRRNGVAAVNKHTGEAYSWAPSFNNTVLALCVTPDKVYVGGEFANAGRNYLACVERATGALTPWNPAPDYYVTTIKVKDTTVYVGGNFSKIGAINRKNIAAIGVQSGVATTWNPVLNNTWVMDIELADTTLYAGGNFTQVNGLTRNSLAEIGLNSGNATAWVPQVNNSSFAYDLEIADTAVYAAGTYYNGPQTGLVAVSRATGKHNHFDVEFRNGYPKSVAADGRRIYTGGSFEIAGGIKKISVAAINKNTGALLPWTPPALNGAVYGICILDSTIAIGGNFFKADTNTRWRFAELTKSTGALTGLKRDANSTVTNMKRYGDTLYLAGYFTTLNGVARGYAASLDLKTGALTNWNPKANGAILDMHLRDSLIYLSGAFTSVADSVRGKVAAVKRDTAILHPWKPIVQFGEVRSLILKDSTALAGGTFLSFNSSAVNRLIEINLDSNTRNTWTPDPDGEITKMYRDDSVIYVIGNFNKISKKNKSKVAALNYKDSVIEQLTIPTVNPLTIKSEGPMIYLGANTGDHFEVYTLGSSPSFQVSTTAKCLDTLPVQITNTSNGVAAYWWNFGEGAYDTSTLATPAGKVYSTAGTYTIQLVTKSLFDYYDTFTQQVTIHPRPAAGFTINNDTQCISSNSFAFTSTTSISSGSYSLAWSLGDGTMANTGAVNHVYIKDSIYTVKLVAESSFGCIDSAQYTVVVNPSPEAAFTVNDTAQCFAGNWFVFTNLSTDSLVTQSTWWSFSDGSTDTARHPAKQFAAYGQFQARLDITYANGCRDSALQSLYVYPTPQAAFNINDSTQCVGSNTFVFTNATNIGTSSIRWQAGDSIYTDSVATHSFDSLGTYPVRLWVQTNEGCADSILKHVHVYEEPQASFSVNDTAQCENLDTFIFTSTTLQPVSMYRWKTGDGYTDTGASIIYSYDTAGTYTVQLWVNGDGCADSTEQTVYVHPAPDVQLTVDTDSICAGDTATFTAASGSATRYFWFSGNVLQANDSASVFKTGATGPVNVVAVNNFLCLDTAAPITLTVNALPAVPTFTYSGDTLYAPTGYTAYNWYKNDTLLNGETTASLYVPTYGTGTYRVAVQNAAGCENSGDTVITVNTGMAGITAGLAVNVYPNPTNGVLYIDVLERVQILLYDINGREVGRYEFERGRNAVNMQQLPTAVYHLQVTGNSGTAHFKIQKQ